MPQKLAGARRVAPASRQILLSISFHSKSTGLEQILLLN